MSRSLITTLKSFITLGPGRVGPAGKLEVALEAEIMLSLRLLTFLNVPSPSRSVPW